MPLCFRVPLKQPQDHFKYKICNITSDYLNQLLKGIAKTRGDNYHYTEKWIKHEPMQQEHKETDTELDKGRDPQTTMTTTTKIIA